MAMEITKKEYERLFNEKMINATPWILRDNLYVNSFVNEIFEEDKLLWRSIFDAQYNMVKGEGENKTRYMGNLNQNDFYYECAVSFKKDIIGIDSLEVISGIMNFTFISWGGVDEFINKTPKNWKVFILNPLLMRYSSTIGLFLIPLSESEYIDLCNEFIQSKTNYPLFLKYLKKDDGID